MKTHRTIVHQSRQRTITARAVKELAAALGADLCGIAPVDRFGDAPKGFHPRDVLPAAGTVVVMAKPLPLGACLASGPVPYTVACHQLRDAMSRISCELCARLEDSYGITAVPVPSEPYEYWDEDKKEGKGLLSLKHAAQLAGLGVFGKNTLLVNRTYGNRLVLGAAVLDSLLAGDPLEDLAACPEDCRNCVAACPAGAIVTPSVDQKLCRQHSMGMTKKKESMYVCRQCRVVCPNLHGKKVQ